jgi:YbgC/YbaW family acyl-CoA thioester hydrolase
VTGPFRYRRRVQFYETDLAGIVHFSWYLRYMEEAEHAMWREAGLSIAPAGGRWSFPRVSASIDFEAPLHFEEEFEVRVRIEALSRRSIRYACEIVRGEVRVAAATMTAVCVDKQTKPLQAADIPDEIVTRLRALDSL